MSTPIKPKTVTKKTTTTPSKNITSELTTAEQLLAAIRMCTENEMELFISKLSAEQISTIIDFVGSKQLEIEKVNKKIKKLEDEVKELSTPISPALPALLTFMKNKKQKNIVTPEGFCADIAAGRAKRELNTSVEETIGILKEAGQGSRIDSCFSAKLTEIEALLGKAFVNNITTTTKEEYGAVKVYKIG